MDWLPFNITPEREFVEKYFSYAAVMAVNYETLNKKLSRLCRGISAFFNVEEEQDSASRLRGNKKKDLSDCVVLTT